MVDKKPISLDELTTFKEEIEKEIPSIPTALSSFNGDSTHRLVTDEEKTKWNGKAEVSAIPTKISQLTNDSGYKTTDNNTTYTLTQDKTDGHKITLTPSTGTATTITIPDNNTTYSVATSSASGLMSKEDKIKLNNLDNLIASASSESYTLSLSATETWANSSVSKTVAGLATTDDIVISPVLSSDTAAAKLQLEAYKCILNGRASVSAANTLKIECFGDTPTTALTLNILVVK